jgi:hypothetical protein
MYIKVLQKTPLLIGFDGEWGLDMRLKKHVSFSLEHDFGGYTR